MRDASDFFNPATLGEFVLPSHSDGAWYVNDIDRNGSLITVFEWRGVHNIYFEETGDVNKSADDVGTK